MLKEFALEPEAVSRWESLRYFADKFGMGQGRLISQYPRNWIEEVWNRCCEKTPLQRQRFQVTLGELRSRLIKTSRTYSESVNWLENALVVHQKEPFGAIIAASSGHGPPVLCADEIADHTHLWQVDPTGKCSRSAQEFAALAGPLLRMSVRIRFIDQHFRCAARYSRPLCELLKHAFDGKQPEWIEYHLNDDEPAAGFAAGLERLMPSFNLPAGRFVDFVRWRRIDGGENLHPRYILTNRGGLRIDYGLDEGETGETTDWNIMTEALWVQRFRQFDSNSQCFHFVDAWRVTASGVAQNQNWRTAV